jgi:hypothetical protein
MAKTLSEQTEITYSMTKNPKPDMTRGDEAAAIATDERGIRVAAMMAPNKQSLPQPSFPPAVKGVAVELAVVTENPIASGCPRRIGTRAYRSYPPCNSSTLPVLSTSTRMKMAYSPLAICSKIVGVSSSSGTHMHLLSRPPPD